MDKILIVEDELIVARDIRKILEKAGYKIAGSARSVEEARSLLQENDPCFVLIDIFLKGPLTGIDFAIELNKQNIPFIYISANSNRQVLEAAKVTSPYGFIVKPFREKDLLITIDIARYRHEQSKKINQHAIETTGEIADKTMTPPPNSQKQYRSHKGLLGISAPMMHVYRLIDQVAPFDTSVLLLGESGTGKEIVATCIVEASERKNKPYVTVNCAAIPAQMMEAELFGYEKGAFTGAVKSKAGKLEIANGGTVLLDEIAELPLDMQAKLLRVLQEKEVQRIGSTLPTKVNIRIIAATNKNLELETGEGRFRLDLYYRLHVFPITLPPLRERREDIPLLTSHFITYYSHKLGKQVTGIDKKALEKLNNYAWPGNVRELQHRIERGMLLAKDHLLHEI